MRPCRQLEVTPWRPSNYGIVPRPSSYLVQSVPSRKLSLSESHFLCCSLLGRYRSVERTTLIVLVDNESSPFIERITINNENNENNGPHNSR